MLIRPIVIITNLRNIFFIYKKRQAIQTGEQALKFIYFYIVRKIIMYCRFLLFQVNKNNNKDCFHINNISLELLGFLFHYFVWLKKVIIEYYS